MNMIRRELLLAAGALPLALHAPRVLAQGAFPSKPLKMIVPFAPGGSNDILARALGPKLGAVLGQSVVVENKAGAGGAIGAQTAARSDPDGHTILLHSSTIVIQPHLIKEAGYDFKKDFIPVSEVTRFPLVLVVHPSLPVKNVAEFLAYAKTKGSELFYGSAGNGSTQNLVGELFNSMAGTKMKHVPFRGNGPATAALLAGDIQVFFDIVPTALSMGQSGKIRTLAVTGNARSPSLPDLPTLHESGVANFEFSIWQGLLLPRGTPQPIVDQWLRATKTALADKELQARLAAQGFQTVGSSSEELARLMDRESAKWGKVIADARIKAD